MEPEVLLQLKVNYGFGGFIIGMLFTAFMSLRGRQRIDKIREKYRALGVEI